MTKAAKPIPDELISALIVCGNKGVCVWAYGRNRGRRAGCFRDDGYRVIQWKGKVYPEHRIIFKAANGFDASGVVDHINGNKQDNRAINLEDVTHQENLRRRKPRSMWRKIHHHDA